MIIKYTIWQQNIPVNQKVYIQNDHEIYQKFSFQGLLKYTKIGIFYANAPSCNSAETAVCQIFLATIYQHGENYH
jgi:hypothetical protein